MSKPQSPGLDGWRSPDAGRVYWGRSLGATMAAYAATVRAPDGVILESGFPAVWSVVRGSPLLMLLYPFSSYRFSTAAFMTRAKSPALLLHGDRDSVIPFALGRALFDRINEPKRFVAISGGDHNDEVPADARTYWAAIDELPGPRRRPARNLAPSRKPAVPEFPGKPAAVTQRGGVKTAVK